VGRTLVAADAIGAGVGEVVFFVRGREASFPWLPAEVPVDAGIVGIVDHLDVISLDRRPPDRTPGRVRP
jgi:microcompartment protein CcmK/EutM